MLEQEQQAVAKAAAKKAKKLRQKLNRQQAQRADSSSSSSRVHLDSAAEPSAVHNDAVTHAMNTMPVATEASADDAQHAAAPVVAPRVPDSTACSSVQPVAQPSSNGDQKPQARQQSDTPTYETDNSEQDDHSFLHDLIQCPITKVGVANLSSCTKFLS